VAPSLVRHPQGEEGQAWDLLAKEAGDLVVDRATAVGLMAAAVLEVGEALGAVACRGEAPVLHNESDPVAVARKAAPRPIPRPIV